MSLRAPLAIEPAERSLAQGTGFQPGDLAPCLLQPEIWVRGHAWYPAADGAPSVRVRLAVARGPTLILRKNVEIPVQNDPFVPPFLHALAPLSRTWPVRSRLLGSFDWTDLDRSPAKLPDHFDWAFFQASAADQRVDALQGDEWIRLEAIHSSIYKFDTQLPSATCAVMMSGSHGSEPQNLPMRLDTVQIDVDAGVCALVFRGHTPLPVDGCLGKMRFVAGLGLPGRSMPRLDLVQPLEANNVLPQIDEDAEILTTSFFDASTLDATLRPASALPFQKGESVLAIAAPEVRPAEPPSDAGQTFMFDERMLEVLHQQNALPFHAGSSESTPLVAQDRAMANSLEFEPIGYIEPVKAASIAHHDEFVLPSELHVSGGVEMDAGSTFFLSADMLALLEGKEATPFVGGAEMPERDEPADVLAGLPFRGIGEEKADFDGTLGSIFLAIIEDAYLEDKRSAVTG